MYWPTLCKKKKATGRTGRRGMFLLAALFIDTKERFIAIVQIFYYLNL
jgi:hypothetical protein